MSGDVPEDGYLGMADPTTGGHTVNALTFLINQVVNKNWTLTLGLVKAVRGGGIDAPAVVDVQPMVNEMDGRAQATPHGTIYNVPCFRLQGGAGAFVVDPKADDIGILAVASRDISSVVKNKAPANPGSFRTFDPADAMYIGGLLGASPGRYVQIGENAISIVFSESVKAELSEDGFTVTVGAVVFKVGADGIISLNGIPWATHTHAVTTAPGVTGPPT
jgi:hypothetical protein